MWTSKTNQGPLPQFLSRRFPFHRSRPAFPVARVAPLYVWHRDLGVDLSSGSRSSKKAGKRPRPGKQVSSTVASPSYGLTTGPTRGPAGLEAVAHIPGGSGTLHERLGLDPYQKTPLFVTLERERKEGREGIGALGALARILACIVQCAIFEV